MTRASHIFSATTVHWVPSPAMAFARAGMAAYLPVLRQETNQTALAAKSALY